MAKIDYTKYTFQELIDRIEFARFFDLPRMTREALKRLKALIDTNEPKYKVYTALLTQTGTDAPTTIVIENTLGYNPVFTYDGLGLYSMILQEATFLKTISTLQYDERFNGNKILIHAEETNLVSIFTLVEGTLSNDVLNTTPIEIRVYN